MKFATFLFGAALATNALTNHAVLASSVRPPLPEAPTAIPAGKPKDPPPPVAGGGEAKDDLDFDMPYEEDEKTTSGLRARKMRRKYRSFLTNFPDDDFPAADTVTCDRRLPDLKARVTVNDLGESEGASVVVVAGRKYRATAVVCESESGQANGPQLSDAGGSPIKTKWKALKRNTPLSGDDMCGSDGTARLLVTKFTAPDAAAGEEDGVTTVTVTNDAPSYLAFSPKKAKLGRQRCLCTDFKGNKFVGRCGRVYRKWAATGELPVPVENAKFNRKHKAAIMTIQRLQGDEDEDDEELVVVPENEATNDIIAPGEEVPDQCKGDIAQMDLPEGSVFIKPDTEEKEAFSVTINNLDPSVLAEGESSFLSLLLACPAHNLVASGLVDHMPSSDGTVSVSILVDQSTLTTLMTTQTCDKVNDGYVCRIGMTAHFMAQEHSCLLGEARSSQCHGDVTKDVLEAPGAVESPATGKSDEYLLPKKEFVSRAIRNDASGRHLLQTDGAKIIFVHGYCSDESPFTLQSSWLSSSGRAREFNGLPRGSYSNDVFARAIDQWADDQGITAFAGVGHSQGGNALLHLYNYYWSGLDNVQQTGRLIQAVGAPWRGTPLAGDIAALGGIFGAGCGTNYDLTEAGANAWLGGISSGARSKVRYYTTSYLDRWWSYDYCHFASDFLLGDPEDGTVEKYSGTLPGGNNGGHKTKQCHTTGMRDPPQTHDMSRNTDMYNNAPQ